NVVEFPLFSSHPEIRPKSGNWLTISDHVSQVDVPLNVRVTPSPCCLQAEVDLSLDGILIACESLQISHGGIVDVDVCRKWARIDEIAVVKGSAQIKSNVGISLRQDCVANRSNARRKLHVCAEAVPLQVTPRG